MAPEPGRCKSSEGRFSCLGDPCSKLKLKARRHGRHGRQRQRSWEATELGRVLQFLPKKRKGLKGNRVWWWTVVGAQGWLLRFQKVRHFVHTVANVNSSHINQSSHVCCTLIGDGSNGIHTRPKTRIVAIKRIAR